MDIKLNPGLNVVFGTNKNTVFSELTQRNPKLYLIVDPEVNYAPANIAKEVEHALMLAKCGDCVCVSTNSYLYLGELSLITIFKNHKFYGVPIQFIAAEDDIEAEKTLFDISNNTVLDAYMTHYQHEQDLSIEHMKNYA